jgi:hypothetical protein
MTQPPEHLDMDLALEPVVQLRSIAVQLQAMIECGEFGLCFADVRKDMSELPTRLLAIADVLQLSLLCEVVPPGLRLEPEVATPSSSRLD